MMEFGIKIYGYDPLLSKEEIENFGAKALSFSFSTNIFLGRKALPKELYPFLAQVLSLERKCVDVRGMFDGEEAKRKGFYYREV
jgi:hypothetical protein